MANKLELRDLALTVDTTALHRNSDRPGCFFGWIAVSDCHLPLKGTGHRSNRHDEQLPATEVHPFTSSELWRLQGFPVNAAPPALAESEFCVPSARAHLQCNDSRKNLTDLQETSQWFSGEPVVKQVIQTLLGSILPIIDPNGFLLISLHCGFRVIMYPLPSMHPEVSSSSSAQWL